MTYACGRRVKTTHDTKRDAGQARAHRIAAPGVSSRERFEDYAERWLVEYRGRTERGLAPSTRKAYALTMRLYVMPYFAGRRLGDIGRADVKAFIDHLASTPARCPQKGATYLRASTIRTIMTPLKAMLAEAYEFELLRTDAGRVRVIVGRSPVTSTAPRTLTREQYAALVEHVRPDDRLLVMLLRWTGLRIAEALGLRWEDFCDFGEGPVLLVRRQWQDGQLVEHTKTPAGARTVAVVPSLGRALDDARIQAAFNGAEDPIFATTRGTHQDSHNFWTPHLPHQRRRPEGDPGALTPQCARQCVRVGARPQPGFVDPLISDSLASCEIRRRPARSWAGPGGRAAYRRREHVGGHATRDRPTIRSGTERRRP